MKAKYIHPKLKKLVYALFLSALTIVIGIIGFMKIEQFSFVNALYMAVITISTVGFSEVEPLSHDGKIFTSAYVIFNLGVFAYVISTITTYLFEGELRKVFKIYKTDKEVKKMKDHVIVCGFGRNGKKVCEELVNNKKEFVLVEKNEEAVKKFMEQEGYKIIIGDATQDSVLERSGISKAKTVITTLPKDADNVFITLTAREFNEAIHIISRASEENSEHKLYRAGAHKVVMPDTLGGLHMAQIITKPYVVEFLDLLNGIGNKDLVLDDIPCKYLRNEYKGRSIKDLDVRNKTGATIIALKSPGRDFIFTPNPEQTIHDDAILIVLGKNDQVQAFKDLYT